MKKILILAVLVLIGGLIAYVLMPKADPVPDFSLKGLDGKTYNNASLKGNVTFINFWFPTCPGCVSEMPKVIKMAQDYQGKNFQVYGIAQPIDPLESVENYAQTRALPFPVMYDADGKVGKAFNTMVYPTSVLINKNGEVLKTFVGEPDFSALYQQIDVELTR
ncbi:peroxiredoxin family protein [Neisseria wadsworthii]|uniref:peroxiredoxin family protein n=1 Tax=Neisseria wadsworthii TaxID=607711 RepID=UPI000D3245F8|nr:TlpA disulfide reductase family protein [Neisseria wadsworthii]